MAHTAVDATGDVLLPSEFFLLRIESSHKIEKADTFLF